MRNGFVSLSRFVAVVRSAPSPTRNNGFVVAVAFTPRSLTGIGVTAAPSRNDGEVLVGEVLKGPWRLVGRVVFAIVPAMRVVRVIARPIVTGRRAGSTVTLRVRATRPNESVAVRSPRVPVIATRMRGVLSRAVSRELTRTSAGCR